MRHPTNLMKQEEKMPVYRSATKEYLRDWRVANKERIRAYQKRYREKLKERAKSGDKTAIRILSDRRWTARQAEYHKSFKDRNPLYHRATVYGLTVDQLEALLLEGCAYPKCDEKTRLVVDHDHTCCSGRGSCGLCVRGALCQRHNVILGGIESDPEFTKWAVNEYRDIALKGRTQ